MNFVSIVSSPPASSMLHQHPAMSPRKSQLHTVSSLKNSRVSLLCFSAFPFSTEYQSVRVVTFKDVFHVMAGNIVETMLLFPIPALPHALRALMKVVYNRDSANYISSAPVSGMPSFRLAWHRPRARLRSWPVTWILARPTSAK